MRRVVGVALGLAVISTLAFVAVVPFTATSTAKTLFTFGSFVGESGAFVGSSNPVRGIPAGGFPWVIADGRAKLMANGEFELEVEGLVIDPMNSSAQAKGLAGINPAPFFFATISCVDNTTAVTNVNTNAVSATTSGNAQIDQMVTLPAQCFEPIVLVRGSFTGQPSGPWFALSGF